MAKRLHYRFQFRYTGATENTKKVHLTSIGICQWQLSLYGKSIETRERTENCVESQSVPATTMNRSTTLDPSKQSQLDSISQRNSVQFRNRNLNRNMVWYWQRNSN